MTTVLTFHQAVVYSFAPNKIKCTRNDHEKMWLSGILIFLLSGALFHKIGTITKREFSPSILKNGDYLKPQ